MSSQQESTNSAGLGGTTIAAVSSGSGGAVAVIRVSGPQAGQALRALAGRLPAPRRASLVRLAHPASGERLDEGLALWFPGPASATGEDMAELQIHGGRAVVAAVLAALFAVPGLRPAERGEFTRRAFLNGRMDLTEAEGLADLIAAETEGQRRLALAHAFGHLGRQVEVWRARLIRAMALVEAGIDFSDEDDVPAQARALARPEAESLLAELDAALADRRGALLREGALVAIAGLPNAGKSSLLNALAARDVAIVSDEPGTTRDLLEVALDLGGQKVTLVDTAGLREAEGKVEAEGIRRARARIAQADLVLWVHDAAAGSPPTDRPDIEAGEGAELWLLANKVDAPGADLPAGGGWAVRRFAVSARYGAGLAELTDALSAFVAERARGAEHPALVRERHRASAAEAAHHLRIALAGWERLDDELLAEELRLAGRALGRMTGTIGVEDLLDVVFREFCIGK
ncbi:tRNA uridine-5-carboxymethylaminomethyl(34) synthesis GTPase MnmE [Ancylobacter sp. TS-1]|uniref:tRNA uridine-5-carboxymethylaminomethyl(34) synthesis GTPase MnmE n=1 Tax=Ancylobacter sp. TS-1 TaxID=1850374 RepID=UPI001265C7FD|nr:tRNA uridine-5-carboxymethylaminomethyl(34) synthesis GTPase MnmE [Ancylobacter sp. TS-1]QFR33922.1 tRNA uridine-5-carboxymethylaminomethyl(34) synthesis GTPase MnmE [Ancylobacter sp. TS-1]